MIHWTVLPGIADYLPDYAAAGIIKQVCAHYKIKEIDLLSKSRSQPLPEARFVCFFMMRKFLQYPYDRIGSYFKRDHATVIWGVRQVESWLENNRQFIIDNKEFIESWEKHIL